MCLSIVGGAHAANLFLRLSTEQSAGYNGHDHLVIAVQDWHLAA